MELRGPSLREKGPFFFATTFKTHIKMSDQTTTNSLPRIGDKAPDFSAVTTTGQLTFSEFNKDSWVIFFAHPADFTPVCTTELVEFAKNTEYFTARNTKLIGVSIDSIHAHLAWVQNVKQYTGVLLDFPIIADLDTAVAQKYGLLHPGESTTAAVRAVFVIDPKGTVRAIIYYPLNVGRNVEEIKRLLTALQTSDKHSVALPVNWEPGEKVVVPPPKTLAEIGQHDGKGYEQTDFYLLKKDLN
jgi:peroxiredoxin 2/4